MPPQTQPPPSDENLVARAQRGDDDAFGELVGRHQGRVYAVAYRITGTHEDGLDVAQEVFLKAREGLGRWEPRAPFSAWLLRLAVNHAIDHRRRIKRRQARNAGPDALESAPAPRRDAADSRARRGEIEERVRRAMDGLSAAQRTAFMLRHYEGMGMVEVAAVLGCSVGSAKVHVFRAVRRLRAELGDLQSEVIQ